MSLFSVNTTRYIYIQNTYAFAYFKMIFVDSVGHIVQAGIKKYAPNVFTKFYIVNIIVKIVEKSEIHNLLV